MINLDITGINCLFPYERGPMRHRIIMPFTNQRLATDLVTTAPLPNAAQWMLPSLFFHLGVCPSTLIRKHTDPRQKSLLAFTPNTDSKLQYLVPSWTQSATPWASSCFCRVFCKCRAVALRELSSVCAHLPFTRLLHLGRTVVSSGPSHSDIIVNYKQ